MSVGCLRWQVMFTDRPGKGNKPALWGDRKYGIQSHFQTNVRGLASDAFRHVLFIFFCFHYSHCGVQITSHFYTWILFPLLFVQWALPEEMPECSTAIFGVWAQSERYPTCSFLCRAPQQLLGNPQICLLLVSSEPSSHRSFLPTGCLLLCWHPRWTIERSQQSDAPGPEL